MNTSIKILAPVFLIVFSENLWATKPLQPGEAYVTRFSGTTNENGADTATIDIEGTVGSIIDLSAVKSPPQGQHWINEPQRSPIKAKDAGQIFGIAIDDNDPAVIYITATSKYGLHRNKDNTGWMEGMWGMNGGPGTVYRLKAENDYQPEIFSEITLNGRRNTGAALGNIAYDKKHKQLYVSDLETGMIHRIDAKTGKDLGIFDHGKDGRNHYTNAETGKKSSMPEVTFDPNSKAKINNCPQNFDDTPECWNLADPRRRVWGLGVHVNKNGNARLYYSVMLNEKDKQSSLWSIGIKNDGSFDRQDVRQEFVLPENNSDNTLSVSDIALSEDDEMVVIENGTLRNLGLDVEEPFSKPYDARAFLYQLNNKGNWEFQGRYDVGNLSKSENSYTNAAGGVDFGVRQKDNKQFIWLSGDALCSETGPCFDPQTQNYTDTDEVHGLQGMKKEDYLPLDSEDPVFILETYMVDTDLNVGNDGKIIASEAGKNDATKIGDVEIARSTPPTQETPPAYIPPPAPSHDKYKSSAHNRSLSAPFHARSRSHYRSSSHDVLHSHHRYGSHQRLNSHYRLWSHDRRYSHRKYNSHQRRASHLKFGSHNRKASHLKVGSHNRKASHLKVGSHDRKASHLKVGSHNRKASHLKVGSHDRKASHLKVGSHNRKASHLKVGSHERKASHIKVGSHSRKASHLKIGSHSKRASHLKVGSHSRSASHLKTGSHSKRASHLKIGSHSKRASHLKIGSHSKRASHLKVGSHSRSASHLKIGSHNRKASHMKSGSHDRRVSSFQ